MNGRRGFGSGSPLIDFAMDGPHPMKNPAAQCAVLRHICHEGIFILDRIKPIRNVAESSVDENEAQSP